MIKVFYSSILISIFFILPCLIWAQSSFQKIYGGSYFSTAEAVRKTSDGGFVMAGYTAVPGGGSAPDGYLVKTDANGIMLWNKSYGGIDRDYPNAVQQTADGGYIISGFIQNNNTFKVQVYVIRMDSIGNVMWDKHLGSSIASSSASYDVEQTTDGGFVVAGTSSTTSNSNNGFLFKLNDTGNVLWGKNYGSTNPDPIYAMHQCTDGGFILAGASASFGLSSYDFYLIKTDSSGNLTWSSTYGDSLNNTAISVKQTTDGGFVVLGYTSGNGINSRDLMILRTDSNGNLIWNRTYGGPASDMPFSIALANDGGYMIVGSTESFGAGLNDMFIIRTDSIGDTLWTKTIGNSGYDEAHDVVKDDSGDFIIAGNSTFGRCILVKLDSAGNSGCYEGPTSTTIASPSINSSFQVSLTTNAYFGTISYTTTTGIMGVDSTLCGMVGLENIRINDDDLLIYPNPASEVISIETNQNHSPGTYIIMDMYSKNILSGNLSGGSKTTLQLDNVSSGIYFVKVKTAKFESVIKLVIQNK